ncbi:MAG: DUF2807 domain-containing protein [Saprospiraceae bacterium]|nr:DUF2807 domain-containing protein [Saprospiraceae bacterium]
MVKIILPITFILSLLSVHAYTQNRGPIADNERTYTFEDFDILMLNGAFEVELFQGNREEVILRGPENILDDIVVNQHGPKVIIGDKPYKNKSLRKVRAVVYVKNLHELEINGISHLECMTPIQSDRLKLYCNGIRNVEFDLDVEDLVATFDGIGSTYLAGIVRNGDIECSGMGNFYAADLRVAVLHFESAGIGKAEIYADQELHIDVSGIGTVRYAGNPEIKSINKDGIGKVRAMY